MPMPKQRDVPAADAPPTPSIVTTYDLEHSIIYIRLLDGVRGGADPAEIARVVLGIDPDRELSRALRVFDAHHARAVWMTEAGYHYLLLDHPAND